MAVTAIVLSLVGFDVNCACYSEYLSARDRAAFSDLFETLGVTQYIHYGTFNVLCQRVINENGDLRKVVGDLVSTGNNMAAAN